MFPRYPLLTHPSCFTTFHLYVYWSTSSISSEMFTPPHLDSREISSKFEPILLLIHQAPDIHISAVNHQRGRVELTTEFLLKLSWSCPTYVTKIRRARTHNIMPADKTVCACNRKDGERRKDETSAEKALFHGTKATPSRHC